MDKFVRWLSGGNQAGWRTTALGWLRSQAAAGLLATLLTLAIVLGLRGFGMLQPLELMVYDRLVLLRASHAGPPQRVVQIGITEDDLNRFNWPLSDAILARLIERLHAARPRAIGIDIFRSAPVGDNTGILDRTLADVPEIVWADRFSQTGWDGIPAPLAIQRSERNGFVDLVPDRGGVVRRLLLYLNDRTHWEASLSLKLALLYLSHDGIGPVSDSHGDLRLGPVALPPLQGPFGAYADLDANGYQILGEFREGGDVPSFSLSDLLDGKVPAAALQDRIVLVGVTAESVKDYVATPLSARAAREPYGVTLQALSAAQLVSHGLDGLAPTVALPRGWEAGLIALAILVAGCIGTFMRHAMRLAMVLIGGAAVILGTAWIGFQHGLWLPVLPLAGGWIAAALLAAAAIAQVERTQRTILMRLFSAHVSGPIARELWRQRHDFTSHGRSRPMRLPATVLFADINGFTTISERLTPEVVVQWLSPYMEAMTALIDRYGGVIERLAGDCVMAMFGPPLVRRTRQEIAADAVAAARYAGAMREALLALNRSYRQQDLPEIRISIGIHSGELVSCSLGSPERQQYATIGDTTNTAARLMTVAKEAMARGEADPICCTVISDATRQWLQDGFELQPLGPVRCKGKAEPIDCFFLQGPPAPPR